MAGFEDALRAWRDVLGDRFVVTDEKAVELAGTATYPTSQRVRALLRPGRVSEVQSCLQIANLYRIPLYPISSGKNWGYGSRVPYRDGSVVLTLDRMDRIVAYDEEMAYVTVEPGVTQAQLYEFLRKQGGRLWIDSTGSTPEASLIGNILERGFGITPYGDHVGRALGYEVVLPDGEILHTGFGIFPDAKAARLDRWGPGPLLEGLFSQSSFGIVTRLTVPLMPAPEVAQVAVWDMADENELGNAFELVRPLQLEGTIRSVPWFGNHFRLIAVAMRHPWSEGDPPLPLERSLELVARYDLPVWIGGAGIYGTAEQVAAARKRIRACLGSRVSRLHFNDESTIAGSPPSARLIIESSMFRAYTGGLMNAVRRAYYRKPTSPSVDADLDGDRVGFVFVNASLPLTGADITAATSTAQQVVLAHGMEPAISGHSTRERVLHLVVSMAYDRDAPGDDDRALAAHAEISARWMEAGYFPYRLGLHGMSLLERAEASHLQTVRSIKQLLDPNGILAPGRYDGTYGQDRAQTGDAVDERAQSSVDDQPADKKAAVEVEDLEVPNPEARKVSGSLKAGGRALQ